MTFSNIVPQRFVVGFAFIKATKFFSPFFTMLLMPLYFLKRKLVFV